MKHDIHIPGFQPEQSRHGNPDFVWSLNLRGREIDDAEPDFANAANRFNPVVVAHAEALLAKTDPATAVNPQQYARPALVEVEPTPSAELNTSAPAPDAVNETGDLSSASNNPNWRYIQALGNAVNADLASNEELPDAA